MISRPVDFSLFDGNREIRSLLRMRDWSDFPAGPPTEWPLLVQTTLHRMLQSDSPISFLWGTDLHYFYNDAYVKLIGSKHPAALTRLFRDSWAEVTDVFAPIVSRALNGEMLSLDHMAFSVLRHGKIEQAYFMFSLLPVLNNRGEVIGLLNPAIETTVQVRNMQLRDFQLELSDRLRPLTNSDAIIAAAGELLGRRLGVARVGYVGVDETGETVTMKLDWTNGELASMAGKTFRFDDFGPLIADVLRAGQILAICNVESDARSAPYAAIYAANNVRSFLAIPLMKEGRLRVILQIHLPQARDWSDKDIAMAEEMVERTWVAAQHAYEAEKRQQAEDKLRENAVHLNFILESAQIGDAVWDLVTGATRRSLQHDRCFGYTEPVADWSFEIFIEHVHPDDREYVTQECQTSIAELKDWHVEFRVVWPDQTVHWIALHGSIYIRDGKPRYMIGIVINITERKRAEKELLQAHRRKDEFLAMLAHELRNPLAPIGTAAELLQLAKLTEERVRQTSEVIGRQLSHMTSLIDDLLDVSWVTRGLIELDKVTLDIRHIVTDAVEQVSPMVQTRGHHLSLHLSPQPAMIRGDGKRLVQVVANILNNAAKYTHDGGHIALRTEVKDSHVLIEVSDDGIGMTEELTRHVFDLFAQAERTSDRSSGGLGLGLALVKSLVELHGGTVMCRSDGLGKGSTFTVCLPQLLEQHKALPPQMNDTAFTVPASSLRVLVVDDNIDAATTLASLLEVYGHEVLVEHESHRALERARSGSPQVCLLDIGLPEMDGSELAQRLRAQPETMTARLIAVTGYGQENEREEMKAAGFDHHFVKPIDTKNLAAILAEIDGN
jgi:PAS domain S-box-containing protein